MSVAHAVALVTRHVGKGFAMKKYAYFTSVLIALCSATSGFAASVCIVTSNDRSSTNPTVTVECDSDPIQTVSYQRTAVLKQFLEKGYVLIAQSEVVVGERFPVDYTTFTLVKQ